MSLWLLLSLVTLVWFEGITPAGVSLYEDLELGPEVKKRGCCCHSSGNRLELIECGARRAEER